MQAIRTARPLTRCRTVPTCSLSSTFSTSASSHATAAHHATAHGGVTAKEAEDLGESIIPLSNIQAQWENMTEHEQSIVHRQLEELQKRDWRSLSLDEKRAAYYVSFGPHGTRHPVSKPGESNKIVLGILAALGVTGLLWTTARSYAHEPPKTLTKEWEHAATERAKEQKMNPITGIASEDYKGKGFVQHK